jgi:excisionase family DNA binding protein
MSSIVVVTADELREIIREEVEAALHRAPTDRGFLGVTEAAELLGVSERTVKSWARAKRLAGTKVGRNWKFREEDLLQAMKTSSNRG